MTKRAAKDPRSLDTARVQSRLVDAGRDEAAQRGRVVIGVTSQRLLTSVRNRRRRGRRGRPEKGRLSRSGDGRCGHAEERRRAITDRSRQWRSEERRASVDDDLWWRRGHMDRRIKECDGLGNGVVKSLDGRVEQDGRGWKSVQGRVVADERNCDFGFKAAARHIDHHIPSHPLSFLVIRAYCAASVWSPKNSRNLPGRECPSATGGQRPHNEPRRRKSDWTKRYTKRVFM